ncbi:prenyltransferase [Aestuariibacter halophilus]|uniref:Prenyltransferase n=1 Tax=Fluctibacter halophilus TaxID=226011 RepID=A0ABS8G460_9ALTE|nr:prenyltransferase [Aestuariibacter halophilus]MCC2615350.1 prenyltransferase [Aestuariibacter halophilus]
MLKTLLMTMRPPFLALTVSYLLLAVSLAVSQAQDIDLNLVGLVCVVALLAHIAVNVVNEVEDDHSGLDGLTERTPFSGGSGALQAHPEHAYAARVLAAACVVLLMVSGLSIVILKGTELLLMGAVGILIIVTYTRYLNRSPWLCWAAPGVGFAGLMLPGTVWVLGPEHILLSVFVAIPLFFQANNLLLLNQIPDRAADAQVGRRTLPVVCSADTVVRIYQAGVGISGGGLLLLAWTQPWYVIGLLPWTLSVFAAVQVRETLTHKALGLNVAATVLTPAALAAAIWINGLV